MFKLVAALILTMVISTLAVAQRGGRPDAVPKYEEHLKLPNPALALDFETTHTWKYIHLLDLIKMRPATISVFDSKKSTISYQGVRLDELIPGGLSGYRVEVFQDS